MRAAARHATTPQAKAAAQERSPKIRPSASTLPRDAPTVNAAPSDTKNSQNKVPKISPRAAGHSTRVGAAQDLAELDIDLAAITQAGGWKSTRMPLQYVEKINAARFGNGESGDGAR